MSIRLISCIRFSMQLLIGESVYTVGWKSRRNGIAWRLLVVAGYFTACMLTYCVFMPIPHDSPVTSILYYFALLMVSMGAMKLYYDVKWAEIMFAGTCGYATQHIAFAATTVVVELVGIYVSGSNTALPAIPDFLFIRFLPYVGTAAVVYFWLIRKNVGKVTLKDRDTRMVVLSLLVVFLVIVISVLVDSRQFRENASLLQNVFCKIYGAISSLLAIFVAYHMSRQNRILQEQELMEEMLHQMSEKQKLSQETIDIINIKCHDLKYRISKISRIEDAQDQKEYIERVQSALEIYDNIFQTGNSALDLILREKSLLCKEYNIKLSNMVDGSVLMFLSSTDLYALFGNLMDNAIESLRKEPDEEKRIISITVKRRGRGSHIHIENYCRVVPQFEGGLPLTTKDDKAFHGFGVRSVQYIVKKYKGELLMRTAHDKFIVDILFCPDEM